MAQIIRAMQGRWPATVGATGQQEAGANPPTTGSRGMRWA
jgi:hypothetical protein